MYLGRIGSSDGPIGLPLKSITLVANVEAKKKNAKPLQMSQEK